MRNVECGIEVRPSIPHSEFRIPHYLSPSVTTGPRFQYRPPDFAAPPLARAPDARFEPAPADGVLPERFFSTTHLPTYVRPARGVDRGCRAWTASSCCTAMGISS